MTPNFPGGEAQGRAASMSFIRCKSTELMNRFRRFPFGPGPWSAWVFASSAVFLGCALDRNQVSSKRSVPAEFVEGSFVLQTDGIEPNALAEDVGKRFGCDVSPPERVDWGGGVVAEDLRNTWHLRMSSCDLGRERTAEIAGVLASASGVTSAEAEAIATVTPLSEESASWADKSSWLAQIRRGEACSAAREMSGGSIPTQTGLTYESRAHEVRVAVIDTGVDPHHPSLKDMFLRDELGQIVGANFVGSGATLPPDRDFDDGTGHGTHVAGLIAAAGSSHEGVASCMPVRIIPVRVLGDNGKGSTVEIERGVRWALEQGADIINLSLGSVSVVSSKRDHTRGVYNEAAARNVVVFAAAGNSGLELGTEKDGGYVYSFPASYTHVISVAATTSAGRLTSFSNRGDKVDIAAPGQGLVSTLPGGSWGVMSGTSMASPVAAGAWALALSSVKSRLQLDRRIPVVDAQEILQKAVVAAGSLDVRDVSSGGLLSSIGLVKEASAKFAQRPVVPMPDAVTDAPSVAFGFAGLEDGDTAGWPQMITMEGVPANTAEIHLFWGSTRFMKVLVPDRHDGTVASSSRWFLYGTQKLWAVALDGEGRLIGLRSVLLKGH